MRRVCLLLREWSPSLADKLLGACENNVFSDSGMPRYDVLSAEIIALVSLGRTEEARMRADELLSYDLPENNVDLLKCSEAFIAARCHDGAREYLEELETVLPTETVLLKAATANYATGDYFAARDELSRLLTVYSAQYYRAQTAPNASRFGSCGNR